MKVRELIIKLLDMPMNADVEIQERFAEVTSVEHEEDKIFGDKVILKTDELPFE